MATIRRLDVRLGNAGDALDRFEARWNRLAEGVPPEPEAVLTLPDLPALLRALSPARSALLERLHRGGPRTVYELAKRLQRDYKNVHTDVRQLSELGLIARRADGRVAVDWDRVRAEIRLAL